MKPLIDADVLSYEVGFSGQPKNEEGVVSPLNFDYVAELLDNKIGLICKEVEATEPPLLFLTANEFIIKQLNRPPNVGDQKQELVPNFRINLSTTKVYKGTRKQEKPFHYYNIQAYMLNKYECKIANGIEADDLMGIVQYEDFAYGGIFENSPSIICSRDKDLRQIPGWHYSWECGKQASIGPVETDKHGWLEKLANGKVLGYGDAFFFYQMLTGDTVDNIQGVPGYGPVKAFKALTEELSSSGLSPYQTVVKAYQEAFKEEWKTHIREMANLLWIVRKLDDCGNPVLFNPKDFN